MEFYIGGYAQGKLRYVLQQHQGEELMVIDGADEIETEIETDCRIILNHFHIWVRRMMESSNSVDDLCIQANMHGEFGEIHDDLGRILAEFIEKHKDCIIISDEIGNGLVPVSKKERDYREQVGRLQIELAGKAEKVERVICGIGQRLK